MAFSPSLWSVGKGGYGFVATGMGKVKNYIKEPRKLGRGLSSGMRALGAGFMGYEALMGYKHGGAAGAATSYASMQAMGYGMSAGMKAIGLGGLAGGMLPMLAFDAAVGAAAYYHRKTLLAPTVREHMRKRAKLEMGSPIQDQFGTIATMRKRGLMAMRESKLNARNALGTEGTYRYRPYFR